jgi:hypothetical protein
MKPLKELRSQHGTEDLGPLLAAVTAELQSVPQSIVGQVPVQVHMVRIEQFMVRTFMYVMDHMGSLAAEVASQALALQGAVTGQPVDPSAIDGVEYEFEQAKLAIQLNFLEGMYSLFEELMTKRIEVVR